MAVVDVYADTVAFDASGNLIQPQRPIRVGSQLKVALSQISIAAADDDGSVYRFLKSLTADVQMYDIKVATTAITDGTDYDIGLYLTDKGAVVAVDVFMSAQTLASAVDFGGATVLDGMDNVTPANYGKTLWEYAAHSMTAIPVTKKHAYDVALTGQTVGSVAGTVSIKSEFVTP